MSSSSFNLCELESCCEIHDNRRKPIKKADRKVGEYPYYGASGIADYIDNFEFDGTYLLLSEDGDNLKTQKTPIAFLAKGRFWVNNHAHVLKATKENLIEYICYALQVADIKSYISGSTRPKITQSDMRKIKINLPPLPEQKAIAHVLGALDDKIELNRKTNTTLEQMAQALFKSWFVDFDPVIDNALRAGNAIPEPLQARAERRKTVLERSTPSGAEEFPSSFTFSDTLNKWIPEGWEVKKAEEVSDITIGKTPPRKEQHWFEGVKSANNFAWVSIKNMGDSGMFISDSDEYLNIEAVKKFNVKRVPENTVILSFKMTVGRVAITTKELCTNEAIAHFSSPKDSISSVFIYHYLKLFNFDSLGSTSSIVTAVNSRLIKQMPFLVPKSSILENYTKVNEELSDKILQIKVQTQTLTQLRDTLLPKLISGKVRLPEAFVKEFEGEGK